MRAENTSCAPTDSPNRCEADASDCAASDAAGHRECGSYKPPDGLFSSPTKNGGPRPGTGPKRKPPSEPPRLASRLRWYCVHIDQRLDLLALLMLTKQGFVTFLPNFRPTRSSILQAVFPGYLFVQFDVVRDRWRPICSTPGVRRLFSATPEQPIAMAELAMADLMQRYGPGGTEVEAIAEGKLAPVPEGTRMTMRAGPFAGFVGICTWSDADRIKLLFEIFGLSSTLNVARSSAILSE